MPPRLPSPGAAETPRGRGCRRAAAQMGRGCRACQGTSGFLRRAFAQRPRHGRRRLQAHGLVPRGSTFAIKMLGRADTQSVVLPTVCAVFGRRTVDYVLDGGGTPAPQHEEHSPSARAAASADPQPVSSAAPVSSSASAPQQQTAPVAASTPSAPKPAAPNRLLRHPRPSPSRPRPSRLTWAKPPGYAPTTPPVLLPRVSSRPSPHPVRPSARLPPRLSLSRSPRRGNPSRYPTTTPWSAALLPMLAGTIFLRSTCRVRRPRQVRCSCPQRGGRFCSSLGVQPRRRQPLRPPGRSPEHPADRGRGQRPHPQRLRSGHHLQAGGVAAQAGILLKKRTPCPGASVFRTCVVWCRVCRI